MSLRKKFLLIPLLLLFLLPFRALADFTLNISLPDCTDITPAAAYYTEGVITSLRVRATDNLVGISSLNVTGTPSPTPTLTDTTSTDTSLTKTYTWNPTAANSPYTLFITAVNKTGNTQTVCQPTYVINSVIGPWIRAVGDVHSNSSINADGGP